MNDDAELTIYMPEITSYPHDASCAFALEMYQDPPDGYGGIHRIEHSTNTLKFQAGTYDDYNDDVIFKIYIKSTSDSYLWHLWKIDITVKENGCGEPPRLTDIMPHDLSDTDWAQPKSLNNGIVIKSGYLVHSLYKSDYDETQKASSRPAIDDYDAQIHYI